MPLQQEAFTADESTRTVPALKHPKQSLTWAQAWMITCKSRRLTVLLPSEIPQNISQLFPQQHLYENVLYNSHYTYLAQNSEASKTGDQLRIGTQ